ncbi:type VI secretion system protein ImpH [Mitsuaria sp. PDC51]|uniref:type VI secretion system baseplate subunit TssG n=1 Tax=unclassified Roseateles TaxID=2626991 RepID=UPI0008DFF7A3|nr:MULTISPECIES: type VI secretion system baseplate subunit TssG [unclassified Roseateles]MBB3293173.1 type VI secretion system protein ImpH [Mitsuaria sp. BK041]MBB3362390.1 type VI secretion system protein ImpH [Mitsuaria sp. BK045]SFR79589.1 type VI secretion system protein ImpH [Mitsuaria sp. PDC51]
MNVRDAGGSDDAQAPSAAGGAVPGAAAAASAAVSDAEDAGAEPSPAALLARRPARRGEHDAALRALFESVEATPWAHDFFALLRRIEGLTPDVPRLGRGLRPSQEAIRLGQEPELDFAPAALASLTRGQNPAPRLGVRFFGLLGPQGPMPLHLTEYTRERLHQRGDPTLSRFLDVFHHRLLLHFYRAWAQSQPAVQHDRPATDRYAAWLGAATGLDGAQRPADSLPQTARLFQAGLHGGRAQHAEGLAKILSLHFGVPVRIEQHVPHWLPVEDGERTRLGFARQRPERIGRELPRLGVDTACGNKAWDRQYRFRVVLGPLTLRQYEGFLPDGDAWRPLNDWIRQYVGHNLQWELQPVLRRDEVPAAALSGRARLGFTSWTGRSGGRPHRHDRGDLHLHPRQRVKGRATPPASQGASS